MLHVKHIISYLYSRYLIGLSFRLTIKILWVQLFNFDIFSTFEILNYLIALQNLRNFVCIHSGFRQNLLQCLTNSLLSWLLFGSNKCCSRSRTDLYHKVFLPLSKSKMQVTRIQYISELDDKNNISWVYIYVTDETVTYTQTIRCNTQMHLVQSAIQSAN